MNIPKICLYIPVLVAASTASAQTTIDLPSQVRTQGRNLDFSAAGATKPMKTGTTLPSSCSVGEMFFKTDAPSGSNLYGCAVANYWTVQTSGGTGGTGGEANTASNTGVGGVGLFRQKSGTDLEFKNLNSASSRVTVANDAANREVDIDVVQSNLDLSAIGGALTASQINALSRQGNGAKVQMSAVATFNANDCAKLDASGNVTTSGAPCGTGTGGESNTASSQGVGGVGLFHQKVGVDLQFKNVNAASNRVAVANDVANREVDIDVVQSNLDLSAIGGALTASQINAFSRQGNGAKVQMSAVATFNANDCAKLDASGNVTTSGAPCGTGTGGEANTASSQGVGGVGLFHQKVGVDLQFKNVNAASNRVAVANDAANREVDIDVVQSNLDLSAIGGALGSSQIAAASKQGNGAKLQLFGGSAVAGNDCAKFDASGNIISAGAPCGTGTGGEANTASSQGVGGVGLFHQKAGVDLQFKNVNAASNRVAVANDAANREVDIDVVQSNLDLAAIGGALGSSQIAAAAKQGTGAKVQMSAVTTFAANDCAKLDTGGNVVSTGAPCGTGTGGESNTASSTGVGGVGLFHQKAGVDLQFKNVNAASNRVSVANDAANREVDIDVVQSNLDLAAIGGALTTSQIATASKQGNGTKLQLFGGSAVAGDDCAKFDASGNIISAGAPCGTGTGGEANTASSTGVGGVGLFHQKAGVDLQFKNVNAASNRVSVANDAANREVDIDVVQSNLDLAAIGGARTTSQIAAASKQGIGAKIQLFGAGTVAANDCAKFDGNGNIVSAGGPCGSGSGGSGDSVTGEFGIVVTQVSPGVKKVGVDTATVPTFLTATAGINFGDLSQDTCLEQTLPLPGAATGDAVAAGWPHTLESGLTGVMFVGAQNTVTIRICKFTTGNVDPALQNFRATIVRGF